MQSLIFLACLGLFIMIRAAAGAYRWRDEWLFPIVLAAVSIRIGLAVLNHHVGPLPGAEVDAIVYDSYARYIATVFHERGQFIFEIGRLGYSTMLAAFYIVGGYHYLIPTFVNLIFFAEFQLLIYGLGRRWGDSAAGRAAVAVMALYPTGLVYTSVSLREAPLMWGLALFVTGLVGFYERRHSIANWRTGLGFAFMVWLHDGLALTLMMVPIAFWYRDRAQPVGRRLLAISAGLTLMVAVFMVAASSFQKLPSNPLLLFQPDFLATMRERKTSYGVGYGMFGPTWGEIIRAVPVILYGFIAAPFPFWMQGLGDLPKMLEGLLSLSITAAGVAAAYRAQGTEDADDLVRRRLIIWMFLYLAAVFAFGSGNTGIAARHRAKFVWMPLLSYVIARAHGRRVHASRIVREVRGFGAFLRRRALENP